VPFIIVLLIVIVSLVLSAFFIFRDAKSFALAPPTPLIDLDRRYDYIFSNLDEDAGQAITPEELKKIIDDFVKLISQQNLIAEDITETAGSVVSISAQNGQYSPDVIAATIKKNDPDLEVKAIHIKSVMNLALTYMADIGALT
jgi:hypothetical protein